MNDCPCSYIENGEIDGCDECPYTPVYGVSDTYELKSCRNCGESDLIDNEQNMFTCMRTCETVGGNNCCNEWKPREYVLKEV
jgi:hypothetical protein